MGLNFTNENEAAKFSSVLSQKLAGATKRRSGFSFDLTYLFPVFRDYFVFYKYSTG